MTLMKAVGAVGLILICLGVLTKKRRQQDVFYILGGVFLEAYSIYIGEIIFMVLQVIFVLVAVWDLNHVPKKKK